MHHNQHELLHRMIVSPFNTYGEIFTVLIYYRFDLIMDSDEYKNYYWIFNKSKYVPVDWKRKSKRYYSDILCDKKIPVYRKAEFFYGSHTCWYEYKTRKPGVEGLCCLS